MKKVVMGLFILLCISNEMAFAGPAQEALSECLADNTTGKDRKDLARWVFVQMATHPEIQSLSNISASERESMDKSIANTFTRLMTESCPTQVRNVVEAEGNEALKNAFGFIGELAMKELMSNPKVSASFVGFSKYIDPKKFESIFLKR